MRAPALVLNTQKPTGSIVNEWRADQLHIYNQTPSAIWVRMGSSAPPQNDVSADVTIPPGEIINLPVNANEFGFAFSDPTALGTAAIGTLGSVGNKATVIASFNEPSLSAASVSYTSLALAGSTKFDYNTSGTVVIGIFDLATWGGLLAQALGTGSAGKLIYDISNDSVNWTTIANFAVNLNTSTLYLFPRTARYIRLRMAYVSIPFSFNTTGTIFVRPCLQEVLQLQSFSSGGTLNYTVNGIAPLASDNNIFYTENYGAIRLSIEATRTFAVELAYSQDNVTYKVIDSVSGTLTGNLFTRIIHQPPPFIRVKVTNQDVALTMNYIDSVQPLNNGATAQEIEKNVVVARSGDLADIVAGNLQLVNIANNTLTTAGNSTTIVNNTQTIALTSGVFGGGPFGAGFIISGFAPPGNDYITLFNISINLAGPLFVSMAWGTGAAAGVPFFDAYLTGGNPVSIEFPPYRRLRVPAAPGNSLWIIAAGAQVFGSMYSSAL